MEDDDWWIAPVEGGEPVRTHARQELPAADFMLFPATWRPDGQVLFLSGSTIERLNLFAARLSNAGRAEGPARRLTSGPGISWTPSVGGDGRLVLDRFSWTSALWEATLDPHSGRVVGEARPVTTEASQKERGFSLTRDGSLLAYSRYAGSPGQQRQELRLRRLDDGREFLPPCLEAEEGRGISARVSLDGDWLAWSRADDPKRTTYFAAMDQSKGRQVCTDCASLAILHEGRELLVRGSHGTRSTGPGRHTIARVRTADGEITPVLDLGDDGLLDADVSADDQWLALSVGRPDGHVVLRVVRLGSSPVAATDVLDITNGTPWAESPRWSADGRLLYHLSKADGFVCVWATPLDPGTKRPTGPPFPVLHAHRRPMKMSSDIKWYFSIAVSERRLVLNAGDLAGEIYTGLLAPPR